MRIRISLTAYLALITSPALADGTRFYYGPDGQSIGSSLPSGPNFRSYYDSGGDFIGNSARAGNLTYFYTGDGSLAGSSTFIGGNVGQ